MKEPVVKITLDLHKESVDTAVSLKHGDTGGRIAITLSEGGFPYEITEDCYAVLTAVKPDGNILYNRCEILGNTVFYEVTAQTTALVGRMPAEVKLYGGEDRLITSAAFRILVQEAVCTGEMVESTGEVSALTHLVSQTLDITRRSGELITAAETAAQVVEQAAEHIEGAVQNANDAAARADQFLPVAQEAKQKAEEASRSVNTLREVVSRFHSNIVETAHGEVVTVSDASDMELAGLRIFGKTTQNGTPTPEAPVPLDSVGDDGSVAVTVCGKNLLKMYSEPTYRGIAVDAMADGGFHIYGSATQTYYSGASVLESAEFSLPAGTYTLSLREPISYECCLWDSELGNANDIRLIEGRSSAVGTIAEGNHFRFMVTIPANETVDFVIWPQLEIGSIATAYEAYKETQTLSLSTPNGLPGLPVTSGGNYTDENGQQWLCDEVDFENGVYVQRVNKIIVSTDTCVIGGFNNSLTPPVYYANPKDKAYLFAQSMCNRFVYKRNFHNGGRETGYFSDNITGNSHKYFGLNVPTQADAIAWFEANPTELVYTLAEPIETALSAEQLAAFAALHTSYPNTTVFNEEGAGMEVKYVADTKLYIDQKFAELAAVLVNQA